ncbi:MAG: hypothetical protein AB8Y71_02095 [Coxiella endosymbiont of Haemaphysalis qinghaiensis]
MKTLVKFTLIGRNYCHYYCHFIYFSPVYVGWLGYSQLTVIKNYRT